MADQETILSLGESIKLLTSCNFEKACVIEKNALLKTKDLAISCSPINSIK